MPLSTLPVLEAQFQIADRFRAAMNRSDSDLPEAQRLMEGIRGRIGRIGVHLADNQIMPRRLGPRVLRLICRTEVRAYARKFQ